MTWVGVDPEYRNAANPLDKPLGDPSPEALRVLENQGLCREVPRTTDWKGNPLNPVEPQDEGDVEVEELESLTVAEIKTELDGLEVDYTSSERKPELIDKLAEALSGEPNDDAAPNENE